MVPSGASPLQVLIEAGSRCPAFAQARIQVARLNRVFETNHQAVPPFDADAVRHTQVASLRTTFGPLLPRRRHGCRWQPEAPVALQVLSPSEREELWPVQEVVVHFEGRAPVRIGAPFEQDARRLYDRVLRFLGISQNSAFRLPTYCPVEEGAPLHLWLHQYEIHDPWNDPPQAQRRSCALVDLRRLTVPPRPQYFMLSLPQIFDLEWLRETLAMEFPELPCVASAYMGPDLIVEHCSPIGNTPLITVYPDMHFLFDPADMSDCVLDTHALLDLRDGFRRFTRVDRSAERQFAASAPRQSGQGSASSAVGTTGHSAVFPTILEVVTDRDADDAASETVMVFSPGQTPLVVDINRLCTPHQVLQSAAAAVPCAAASTLHVPTLAPLIQGHVPSIAVIPDALYDRRFLLVDARRVCDHTLGGMWLQEAPQVVDPVILIAILRRAQPALRDIGALYLDSLPVTGYAELSTRVTLLSVVPVGFEPWQRPVPLCNSRSVRTRAGFMQSDLRAHVAHRRRRAAATTTTTTLSPAYEALDFTSTTTTPAVSQSASPDARRGAVALSVDDCWIRVFVVGLNLHVECATLQRTVPMSDMLTQLSAQLWAADALHPELIFRANDRAYNDHDAGFSVYLSACRAPASGVAWIDALPYGGQPFPVRLPFVLTERSIAQAGGNPALAGAHIAVNGIPWHGLPLDLQHCDVVTLRPSHSALFSIPLSAVEVRLPFITALLLPRRGPSSGMAVVHDGLAGGHPPAFRATGITVESIRACWQSIQLSWEMKLGNEGGFEQCLLVSATMPPLIVSMTTRCPPEPAHVNMWYRTHFQRVYGPKSWCDSGLAYGRLTVLFDSALKQGSMCAWIFTIGENLDVVLTDRSGRGLINWPAPEGWRLTPISVAGPLGQAGLQLRNSAPPTLTQFSLPQSALDDAGPDFHYQLSDDEGLPVPFAEPDPCEVSSEDDCVAVPAQTTDPVAVIEMDDTDDEDLSLLQLRSVVSSSHAGQGAGKLTTVEETRPRAALLVFGRPIPTPCRAAQTGEWSSIAESQCGSRDDSAAEHTGLSHDAPRTRFPDVAVSDLTPAEPFRISLQDSLPLPCAAPSRQLVLPCGIDDFLHAVEPVSLAYLSQDWRAIPALHPTARQWVAELPAWDRSTSLRQVTLYTDGSFQPGSNQASWAVVGVGHTVDGEVFLGFAADQVYTSEHPHYLLVEGADAHAAEMIAMFVAVSMAAACDGRSFLIIGDCTSVLDVAKGGAASSAQRKLSAALLSMHIAARERLNTFQFRHSHSHQGLPGNEFADSAAKAALTRSFTAALDLAGLSALARKDGLAWAWWAFTSACPNGALPGVDDENCTLPDDVPPLPCAHPCASLPGIPAMRCSISQGQAVPTTWHLRVATYNANSLRKEVDRSQLDAAMSDCGVQIVGVQESRHWIAKKTRTRHYHCFCSSPVDGNFGCQIWVSDNLPLNNLGDNAASCLEPSKATFVHSSPRVLAICIPAGNLLFGIVAAHAPIDATSDDDKLDWWDSLRGIVRKLPRRAIPVILADCNARFQSRCPTDTVISAAAANGNATALQQFCRDTDVLSPPLHQCDGSRVVTWVSPTGKPAQLDYVLWPAVIAAESRTLGNPWTGEVGNGLDHRPLIVEARWAAAAMPTVRHKRFDTARMTTEEGQRVLAYIHQTVPSVPWSIDVDDHLQIVNDHIHRALEHHFPANFCKPRQPHISPVVWQAVRDRRHARRLIHRSKALRRRDLLQLILMSWRQQASADPAAPGSSVESFFTGSRRRQHRALLHEARLGIAIRVMSHAIATASAKDAAAHTRAVLRDGKARGPAALYDALRGVLKIGRRYKPPLVLPALCVQGETLSDPVAIQQALAAHFAEPEHGTAACIRSVAEAGHGPNIILDPVKLVDLPNLAEVALGWISLPDRKASGASGIPAEVYKYASVEAARAHASLLVKICARDHWPVLWRGTLNVAIPKPGKDGSRMQSWRSIALSEAAYKGVGRALRHRLSAGLRRIASSGQHGSLPKEQIGLPAQHVQAYLQLLMHEARSGAVIFLDGRSAYYATIREYLFSHACDSAAELEDLIRILIPDEELIDEALSALIGPGLLQQAGLPSGLQEYLRANLRGTWFSLDLTDPVVQQTRSGTSPGSPLADLLFQFVQSRFMRSVTEDLAAVGLAIRVKLSPDPVCPQGWADDVAVLLPPCNAGELAGNICTCLPILDSHSRSMGVSLNYDSGKTETLICVRGKGSVDVRRSLLSPDEPSIMVDIPHQPTVCLRLVERYQHLGNMVCMSASCTEDVRAKMQSADGVFRRLQSTLLRNPELTADEKVLLVHSMVLAKVKYGAGQWTPRSAADDRCVHMALSKYWRMACRAITNVSTKFLDEQDIAAILGVLTADECMRVERCRQLCVVAAEPPGFLWSCLCTATAWLQLALSDLQAIGHELRPDFELPGNADSATLHWLCANLSAVQRLVSRYARARIRARSSARDVAMAKAARIQCFETGGGVLLPVPTAAHGHLACEHCSMRFASRANLAAHMSTVHGQKAAVSVAAGSCCLVCRVEWWTTFRLREHLRHSPHCLHVYQAADLSESASFESVGNRAQRAWKPPTVSIGPQPWWATLSPDAVDIAPAPRVPSADVEALQLLADRFPNETLATWAPEALQWVRLHTWQPALLSESHAAHAIFSVLADIVEQASEGQEPRQVLHSSGASARREGNHWWLSLV